MTEQEFQEFKVSRRPYPFDFERKQKVAAAMYRRGIRTVVVLAKKININYEVVVNVVNGVRRSPKTEATIAAFFGLEVDELFPPRTERELAEMNMRQKQQRG